VVLITGPPSLAGRETTIGGTIVTFSVSLTSIGPTTFNGLPNVPAAI